MKKWLLSLGLVLLLLVAVVYLMLPRWGMSPSNLRANIDIGSAMSAKLACSARYVSGFNADQAKADVVSYSPVFEWVTISYDDEQQRASASLLGMGASSAKYRPGLGCTLERTSDVQLDGLQIPELSKNQGMWPAGDQVGQADRLLQKKTDEILARDNLAGLQTRALVVVHGGDIKAESYAGDITGQTPLLGWSMGKSITAMMFGRMEMQGLLSITENNLFPDWANDQRRDITLGNLLQMSSGLDFSEIYAPGSDATEMLFLAPSAAAVALRSPPAHAPGSYFAYSSGTTNLLMYLMTERLGGPQAALDYMWQEIFMPLGIRNAVFEPDPSGVMVASSYIYASPRDWARLGLVNLNEGLVGKHRTGESTVHSLEDGQGRLFTQDWSRRARTPNNSSNSRAYGYQFWLNDGGEQLRWPDLPADAYAMTGNRQQVVMIIPSLDMVIVRLGWSPGRYPTSSNFAELVAVVVDSVLEAG
ncbi:MAG: beta-lactamase family protein [Pseudomonadaceae bacterium]|nr:beta-lactamase family protein [Pseudomonadaceae bacterium]